MATVGLNVIAADDAQLVLSAVGVQGASSVAGFFDVSGVTYTLSDANKNRVGRFNNASGITVTVPSGLSSDFSCMVLQTGAGQVTVSPASGVTRRSALSATKTAYQYAAASIFYIGNNEFLLGGEVTA
jgi:hypothetical protein